MARHKLENELTETDVFAFVGDVGPVVNGAVFSGSGVNSLQHRCIVSLSHIFCY